MLFIYLFLKNLSKVSEGDGNVELFHSPFPNCHLHLNQLCFPPLGLLLLLLTLTTNALLTVPLPCNTHTPTDSNTLSQTHARTDAPYVNTQRPAACQIGTAGINT